MLLTPNWCRSFTKCCTNNRTWYKFFLQPNHLLIFIVMPDEKKSMQIQATHASRAVNLYKAVLKYLRSPRRPVYHCI